MLNQIPYLVMLYISIRYPNGTQRVKDIHETKGLDSGKENIDRSSGEDESHKRPLVHPRQQARGQALEHHRRAEQNVDFCLYFKTTTSPTARIGTNFASRIDGKTPPACQIKKRIGIFTRKLERRQKENR